MDPATMMAIMNVVGKMGQGSQSQGQQQAPQPAPQMKPYMPGAIPPINTTDYGAIIKQMMMGQSNPMPGVPAGAPGQQMPGQGQSF